MFLEIGDIPVDWLKGHYDVIVNDTVYNDSDADSGPLLYKNMKSLTTLAGFSNSSTSKRLGNIADSRTIYEAIVAVPYVIKDTEGTEELVFNSSRKSFINIPTERYESALASSKGTSAGDSLDTAGESIRKLVQKMERYILPPQFDFLNNSDVKPIVMYIFEFEFKSITSTVWLDPSKKFLKVSHLSKIMGIYANKKGPITILQYLTL